MGIWATTGGCPDEDGFVVGVDVVSIIVVGCCVLF